MIRPTALFLSLILMMSPVILSQSKEEVKTSTPLRLLVQNAKGKPRFILEDKIIPYAQLPPSLGQILNSRGKAVPVMIAFDDSLPFSEIENLRGIVGKVGFTKARYFAYDQSRRNAVELVFGVVLPFDIVMGKASQPQR